jgi:hypothetical protein
MRVVAEMVDGSRLTADAGDFEEPMLARAENGLLQIGPSAFVAAARVASIHYEQSPDPSPQSDVSPNSCGTVMPQ